MGSMTIRELFELADQRGLVAGAGEEVSMGGIECGCRDYGRDSSKCQLHWYREMDVRLAAEKAAEIVLKKMEGVDVIARLEERIYELELSQRG